MGTDLDFDPGPIESRHFGGTVRVVVESFGYLHNPAPAAHVTIDLREALYNPHHDPAMRALTGLDPLVRDHVLATPGAEKILHGTALQVFGLLPGHHRRGKLVKVAFGCAGGRHRSVVAANELTNLLLAAGIGAEVSHRDILRPVVRCLEGGA
jgi:UPF0042 nucleotide-binding protein